MAPIVIEKVLSVSSEDPNHPSESLLKTNYDSRKWKCKSPGEKQISVILQFEKSSVISKIDVGNEHTAFLEILVGKSTGSEGDFKVLLITSTLMGLQDSKYSKNPNGVRFFKKDELTKDVREEKWDRVKVICSQPFNKHVQYGLSFIIFHSDVEKDGSSKADASTSQLSLGDSSSDKPSFTPGSLFARRKELTQDIPKAGAAAVRAAAATLDPSDVTFSLTKPKPAMKSPKVATKKITTADDAGPSSPKVNMKRKATDDGGPSGADSPLVNKKPPNGLKGKTPNIPSPPKKAKPRKTKPFSNLFDDVVFVISGFVNPQRSDIRNKALAMGAKYKADWDKTCTHLICAFSNTPKFREVRGKGKIVRKEWIENSYARRTRIPWRRYALDKNDESVAESEEEIYDPTLPSGSPIDNRRRVNSSESEGDSDEEVQRVLQRRKALQLDPPDDSEPSTSTAVKQPSVTKVDQTSSDFNITVKKEKEEDVLQPKTSKEPDVNIPIKKEEDVELKAETNEEPDGIYDVDTDVGEDFDDQISESRKLPYLPEFFDDATFYICKDLSESTQKELRRYIIAHKGTVLEKVSDEVEYMISESADQVKKIKEEYPQLIAVKPEWVWRSHDENRVFPTSEFEL